jgi:hypothetical protein
MNISVFNNTSEHLEKISQIMISGGDQRLDLFEGLHKNKYGCVPYPFKHLSYSSCTASTIGKKSFKSVKNFYEAHSKSDLSLEKSFQSIRDRLRNLIDINEDIDIALGPSGTDLELISLIATTMLGESISNIIIGEEEVGSGITMAAKGRHFSTSSPTGIKIKKGTCIQGFEKFDIDLLSIPIRDDKTGQAYSRNYLDQIISHTIDAEINKNRKVLLHLVFRSKTGMVVPDLELITKLKKKFTTDLDIVADCCQYRMSNQRIRSFLSSECMVIITGSKFFSGAPFSAAILMPPYYNHRFRNNSTVPTGLGLIFSRNEMPKTWKRFYKILSPKNNIGLLLRWESALSEMTDFYSISYENFKQTASLFDKTLNDLIQKNDYCEIFHQSQIYNNDFQEVDQIFQNTLQTIVLKNLDIDDSKYIYKGLYNDMSEILKSSITEKEKKILQAICHLGQPVKVKKNINNQWIGSLRLALSSRHFSEISFKPKSIQKKIFENDINLIIKKIELLTDRLDLLKKSF